MKRFGIPVNSGFFRVAPKPRGGDWLDADLNALKSDGVTFVVSLLTDGENEELGLVKEKVLAEKAGLKFYSFPINDRSVPSDKRAFENFVSQVMDELDKGGCGFFHCRAGLGRAPLLGCSVLIKNGFSSEEAWRLLEEYRGQPVPDTETQKKWVEAGSSSREHVESLDEAFTRLLESEKLE